MSKRIVSNLGIFGVLLFASTCILGGLLIEGYDETSQYISETYAIDTEYGVPLRTFGHIPSGILFALFGFFVCRHFPPSGLTKLGFYGLAIFYGIGTIIVSIFPCDSGCNKEFIDPSTSQIIHNAAAVLVYLFTPLSILLTGLGLKKEASYQWLSMAGIILGILSAVFVYVFFSEINSEYTGVYQRIIETLILIWILVCALKVRMEKKL